MPAKWRCKTNYDQYGNSSIIYSDPEKTTAYIIDTDQQWGSTRIARVIGSTIQPVHLTMRGCEQEYLARWKRIGLSLFAAWLLHVAILIGGTAWLTRKTALAEYEFGNQQAILSPLRRRAIATSIDVILLLVVAITLGRFLFAGLGIGLPTLEERVLANEFFSIEQNFVQVFTGMSGMSSGPGFQMLIGRLINRFLHSITSFPDLVLIVFLMLGILIGGLLFLEGQNGVTPGKWLLGLRTVRTTLRPCGFARALDDHSANEQLKVSFHWEPPRW